MKKVEEDYVGWETTMLVELDSFDTSLGRYDVKEYLNWCGVKTNQLKDIYKKLTKKRKKYAREEIIVLCKNGKIKLRFVYTNKRCEMEGILVFDSRLESQIKNLSQEYGSSSAFWNIMTHHKIMMEGLNSKQTS